MHTLLGLLGDTALPASYTLFVSFLLLYLGVAIDLGRFPE